MKRFFMWFLLLNKRLYKKITYIGILLLIPVLVFVFSLSAQDSSGIITVVLAQEGASDPLTVAVMEQLQSDTIVMRFYVETPENALEHVQAGKADAAWIFPGDMGQRLTDYVNEEKNSDGFIRVVEREQSVPLRLARERLSAAIHCEAVKITYLEYIRQIAPETADATDQELLSYMASTDVTGELFAFYDISGNPREENANYLTTPIRGMLAALAVIGAAVTAMYYHKDEKRGIFSFLPEKYRILGEFGYQMISALNLMTVILLALILSGLQVSIWRELILFILYCLCCALFGMLLRAVFGGGKGIAVLLPVLTVAMLTLCPVFFDFPALHKLQLLLPPTYYINGGFNPGYVIYLVAYMGVLILLNAAIFLLKQVFVIHKRRGQPS